MRVLSALSLIPVVLAALDPNQMSAHLKAGAPLLGTFQQSSSNASSWMSGYGDSTTIQSLSIPGTHDTLTWNVSGLVGVFTKTQDLPFFQQLDSGARFIDLRVGDSGNGTIQLYHGTVLLDPVAQLVDIFWGLYYWLDAHPSETVIVSVKVDAGNSTVAFEQNINSLVTGPGVADYWVQSATLPTLGQARHKAILLRRFSFTLSPPPTPIGIDASTGWADNNPAFTIPYTTTDTIYIEDFYDVNASDISSAVSNKFSALSTHLDLASGGTLSNQLFISFASGYSGVIVNPLDLAVGSGSTPGVNNKTLDYLTGKKGGRFGVVLFDFIGSDSRLVPAVLSQSTDLPAPPTSVALPGASNPAHSRNWASGQGSSLQLVALVGISITTLVAIAFF